MAPTKNNSTRELLIGVCVLLAAGVLLGAMLLKLGDATGLWMDDAVYLVNAQSLAEGHGYRHLHLPGEPWQTKYPPLYPMVLSVFVKAAGSTLGAVTPAHLFNAVCWTLAAVIAFVVAVRRWGMGVWLALAGALLAVLEPQSLDLTHSTMSEALFALLSTAAIACAIEARSGARWWAWALAAGGLAALSVWTRSIGIACAGACVGALVLGRKWKPGAVCGVVIALLVGGLMVWRSGLHERNAAIPQAAALGYDLDYRLWIGHDLGGLARVAWINSGDLLLSVTQRVAPWPGQWVIWAIGEGWVTESLYLMWCLIVVGSIAVGAGVAWKRSNGAAALYVAGSFAMMLVWPFPPSRFVMPLTPILTVLFVLGIAEAVRWVVAFIAGHAIAGDAKDAGARSARMAASISGRLSAALCVVLVGQTLLTWMASWGNTNSAKWAAERNAGIALIKERTAAGSVVAGPSPAYLWLASGRQAVILAPADEPIAQHYAPSRAWRMLGTDAPNADETYFRTMYETRLQAMYKGAGVTHILVPGSDDLRAKLMLEYFTKNGTRFRSLGRGGAYYLYEYTPPVGG